MKKTWMEIFLLIGAVATFGMIVSNALFRVNASTAFKAAIFSAILMTSILITMSIIAYVADGKGRMANPVSITFLANCCVCFAGAFFVSKIAFYVVTGLFLFTITSSLIAIAFAQMTGTKRIAVFASLSLQMLGIVFAILGSWVWASLNLGALLFLFILVRRNPYYFGDPDLIHRE